MDNYTDLVAQLTGLLAGERDPIANAANVAALIFHSIAGLNWAGFYFTRGREGDDLVLGPFQGKPACARIAPGRGVCGTAAARRASILVADVHAFPDHIACDANSRAELVVPLLADTRLLGVLDVDSPIPGRFDAADQAGFERVAALYVAASCFD